MTPDGAFLSALGQALATMGLYDLGHPARERAVDASFEQLLLVLAKLPTLQFSFLGGEAIVGQRPMTELTGWEWGTRLAAAGIERIEVDAEVTREDYFRFVDELWGQLCGNSPSTAAARQLVRSPARFGALKLQKRSGGDVLVPREGLTGEGPIGPISLIEELGAIAWAHQEVERGTAVPMPEVEAVVASLSATIHSERRLLLPLLSIKEFDQYTLTHSCNVAVLTMGCAERLGLDPASVRAMGVSGLLHDIGKVKIPHDLLVKPGRYSEQERELIQKHPSDGAKIILDQHRGSDLAAVVAYEHHIFLDGRGYPALQFSRGCHYASRIVHVCDVYDALCTNRPYRQAWDPSEALAYIEKEAGVELDPEVATAFGAMIREATICRMPMAGASSDTTPLSSGP